MSSPTPPVPPPPPPAPRRRRQRRRWLFAVVTLVVVGGGVGGYLWFRPPPKPQPDMETAIAANNRGVGRVERITDKGFPEAEKEFEEAIRLAPDWITPRVNLGIALFNQDSPEKLARARETFADVLRRDPDNKHAHYCLGVICEERGPYAEAHTHYQAVNRLDPEDAHTWLRLGMTHPNKNSPEARECFEKALRLNPYLNAARYNLALIMAASDPVGAKRLFDEKDRLHDALAEAPASVKYSEQGKYADVIGRDPAVAGKPVVGPLPLFEPTDLKVTLAGGAKWAPPDLRERFGGTVVLFDFNGDGRPDIFLAAAAVEGGNVRDVLLRNDAGNAFTEVPFPGKTASFGAAAGDFDNDGRPDLAATGPTGVRLYRNLGGDKFEDASAAAGLDKLTGEYRGCGWLDIDQDGDLDLVLCGPVTKLKPTGGPVFRVAMLFENVGIAEPGKPALTVAFQRSKEFDAVSPAGAAVGFLAADLDSDRDVDVLLLPAGDPAVIENDRLMRFKSPKPTWTANLPGSWNGGLVLDANHDERSDLFLVRSGGPPVLLLSKGTRDFEPATTNSPELKQATAIDIDMDGWTDVVGLGADGKPVLLHNQADGSLKHVPDAFGPITGLNAVAVADLTGDGLPDLLTWSADGLKVHKNRGNGNAVMLIDPTGKRDKGSDTRTNADGIGTWLVAQAGPLWTGVERTTVCAGLGQSLLPTTLGIGKRERADVVRFRWPDTVVQAELDKPANQVVRIAETNRKGTSCPVLMTWDGEKFVFVTDFLGVGALGESGPDGSIRPPRGEESVKIEASQLVLKDGQFVIKIAEPMDEVLYLDHLKLEVIDAPGGAETYPDERFVFGGALPTQKLLSFRSQHRLKAATDHKGRDVLPLLLDRDRRAVDGFARRSWLGYAEDHSVMLDFGELPAGKWHMVLAGWTEYPYPESMYAATRAGIALKPPTLERPGAGEKWETCCDLGFPAGLPRVMTRELPADFRGGKLRISTNMQVFWDRITVAQAEDAATTGKVTPLTVSRADLAHRGFMQEVYPNGRPPVAYDDAKTEPVAVTAWKGHLTRLGEVTDLLRAADDRFVLCGPADEITVRFDAKGLPELPAGWTRSFVLRTHGYCKDTSSTTVTGGEVGPLPFRAMPNYPHFGAAKPPATDADKWHTRPAGGR